MQSERRLSDADLANAVLDIEDPNAVENLSRERPDRSLPPTIVGEYHLATTEPAVWCCHCQAHRHHNGFVIENQTGCRHLIGSHCGPKHYGLSFVDARRHHKELKQRQGLGQRLVAILAVECALLESISRVLQSEGLRRVDEVRLAIKKAGGDAFFRLKPIALAGSALTESVRVRDYATEARRTDNSKDDNAPIYTFENQRIGTLDGAGLFIENGDCRDALLALRTSLAAAHKMGSGVTDTLPTKDMLKIVKKCEEAHSNAQQAIALARRVPAFFSAENIIRLERWSEQFESFSIRGTDLGIEIIPAHGPSMAIAALMTVELDDLPSLALK